MELRSITVETLAAFAQALRAEERCTETIKQYTRSVASVCRLGGCRRPWPRFGGRLEGRAAAPGPLPCHS